MVNEDDINHFDVAGKRSELFGLAVGRDGVVKVDLQQRRLHPLLKDPPTLRHDPEDAEKEIQEQYLRMRLDQMAGDVANSGCSFSTVWQDASVWSSPFPATSAVVLSLPEEQASSSAYSEVEIDHIHEEGLAGLVLRPPSAAQGSREYVRGSSAFKPFTPGGEAVVVADTAAMAAAEEARSGVWACDLDRKALPKVLAPGMPHGVFGPWQQETVDHAEEANEVESASQTQPLISGVSSAKIGTVGQDNSGDGENAKMTAADLFKGVWMIEDDAEESTSGSEEEDANVPLPTAISSRETMAATNGKVEIPEDPAADSLLEAPLSASNIQSGITNPLLAPRKKAAASDHQWAVRGGLANVNAIFNRLRPSLAMTHPFELDTFQKEAVIHLEQEGADFVQGNSVFVAAHTSAGKTVVAEYAFALARQHCTRAIYTSPIKTISNQKYRDFSAEFEVGLLTGDVSIKPEAPCLIMTTEILRSMLYKGADIIRDIEWVVFDEVHYVNDAERGVVWEEVIIMLPAHVNLVLLSATVPNVMEFADWVGRTKRKLMYVTGTTKRPVPLEHNLYYDGQLYTICRQEYFLSEGVAAAKKAWKAKNAPPTTTKAQAKAARPTGRGEGGGRTGPQGGRAAGGPSNRGGPGRLARGGASNPNHARAIAQGRGGSSSSDAPSDKAFWMGLVKDLDKRHLLPAVVFCFSKKKVDLLADTLPSMDFTSGSEKSQIHIFFDKAVARLKGGDRELPQILRLREMLKRGLGVHHAGLLPIMKEVVEMLFCQGVIKILFSTETFAMGVNAPARCVIFHGLRKHDGKSFRTLLSGEYTQMAGRAGRRGLDLVGTVIIACQSEVPEEGEIRTLLTGRATKLESQFRLTYTMILNLLRVEDLKVEDMLKRSFAEFHAQKAQPESLLAMEKGQAALAKIRAKSFPQAFMGTTRDDIRQYHYISQDIDDLSLELQDKIMSTRAAQQALTPGRLLLIKNSSSNLQQLAVILAKAAVQNRLLAKSPSTAEAGAGGDAVDSEHTPPVSNGIVPGLQLRFPGKGSQKRLPRRGNIGGLDYLIDTVNATAIEQICKERLKLDGDEVMDPSNLQALSSTVGKLQRAAEAAQGAGGEVPILDPEKDLKINQLDMVTAIRERQQLMQVRAGMPCQREPAFGEMWAMVHSEALLEERLKKLAHQLSDANLQQMPEFHQRVEVLKKLEYIAPDNTVQMKGRVACEVSAGNELVTTEIIFAGVLSDLTPEEAVALLSALVFQEKSEMEGAPAPNEKLEEGRRQMQSLAVYAGQVQKDCGLDIVPAEFCKEVLKFGLLEVVYNWAMGTPFEEISRMTDIMEGSIVRCVVRLDEQCRQLMDAARVIGNTALFKQMEAASASIKRDVVFAASLYTT